MARVEACYAGGETAASAHMGADACPLRLGDQRALDCYCSARAASQGAIYGSNFSTDDSAICRAALHAGVFDEDGGRVSVYVDRGQPSCPGRSGAPSSHGAAGSGLVRQPHAPHWFLDMISRASVGASASDRIQGLNQGASFLS